MKSVTALNPRLAKRIAVPVGSVSAVLLLASALLAFLYRNHQLSSNVNADVWGPATIANAIEAVGVCILAVLIVSKRPSNLIGWLFLTAGATLALGTFGGDYAVYALIAHHGSLPGGYAAAFISNTAWVVPTAMLFFLLFLFPTGTFPSDRWRRVGKVGAALAILLLVLSGLVSALTWSHPFANGPSDGASGFVNAIFVCVFVGFIFGYTSLLLMSLVALVQRFRRSRGEERLQLKWFTFAAAFVVPAFIVSIFNSNQLVGMIQPIALSGMWVAIGISMLKYRLYEIDVVVRKTVVGGVLVAFVTLVYLVIVAGVGALGSQVSVLKSGPLIAAATAIVAIAFQPVLRRARHLANRLVYGDRATPYEILSEFSERMGEAYATDDLPQRMSRILAEGTGATSATVWLHVAGQMRPAATWPADAAPPAAVDAPRNGDAPLEIPDAGRMFAVRHQGELLGALSVVMPPEEPLASEQEKLCTDLAAQAGLVLRNVRLIEDLRASRQRLVAAQDEERRKIERNLHDGAQQQLVALAVKGRLAAGLLDRGDAGKTRALLDEIQNETGEALETLRDLARGIYPPLLADQGLSAALQAQIRKAPLPVDVDADGVGRHSPDVEAAVYFCCLEALQNVSKYAHASRAWVSLSRDNGAITFVVRDDGAGFEPERTKMGTGIQGIADRLAALGGELDIASSPGAGTSITGRLPV